MAKAIKTSHFVHWLLLWSIILGTTVSLKWARSWLRDQFSPHHAMPSVGPQGISRRCVSVCQPDCTRSHGPTGGAYNVSVIFRSKSKNLLEKGHIFLPRPPH